jgi:hypothetical protein
VHAEKPDRMRDAAARCCSQALLSPYRGRLRVISPKQGEAGRRDGIDWIIHAMDERIAAHKVLPEVAAAPGA